MNYLPTMTEDEIRYICSIIPEDNVISYFKRNPKEFAKVRPGFRPDKASILGISNLLFNSRKQHFISSLIEKHISRWLKEIDAAITEKIDKGESKESALLQVLPYCFFIDNIGLYFKLTGEVYAEETLAVLETGIKIIKELDTERERLQTSLNEKTSALGRAEAELEQTQREQNKTNKRLSERLEEINGLKRANADLDKTKATNESLEQTIVNLRQKAQEREDYIQQLKINLSSVKDERLQLEQKIREELAKQHETEKYWQESVQKPRCPKDHDEFRDYLGYNFESLGIPANVDYYSLLKEHLSEILFQGKPIIISKSTATSLMKCVSNTLVETSKFSTLVFSDEITEDSIASFLSQDKRILCLDNFIGNFNETLLITHCDRHRDKIVFLTSMYDHTLAYVPDELLRYCHYLNCNRIEALIGEKELTEDPSVVVEIEVEVTPVVTDARWSAALKEILDELGFRGALSAHKMSLVTDELNFCRLLAFDILPYCKDVLKVAPYSISERLVKYAGDSGRCPYKALFRRWFV